MLSEEVIVQAIRENATSIKEAAVELLTAILIDIEPQILVLRSQDTISIQLNVELLCTRKHVLELILGKQRSSMKLQRERTH